VNPAYISALAALAGSIIGGLTSFAAAWITQRQQANVQWLLHDKSRRQELYKQFIDEASKLYADALVHNQVEISALVSVYALISRMRVISSPEIVEKADKVIRIIVDTYFSPNKTFSELRDMMGSDALDPLRAFSEACREEMGALTIS
jgi:hypothetical protein